MVMKVLMMMMMMMMSSGLTMHQPMRVICDKTVYYFCFAIIMIQVCMKSLKLEYLEYCLHRIVFF